jgi:predicted phosphodiesterase
MEKAARVAAIYDIHGNLPALEAVLPEVERAEVDLVAVGGDATSGPMSVEVLDRLAGLGDLVRFVRGNAAREVVLAYDGGRRATLSYYSSGVPPPASRPRPTRGPSC